MSPAVKKPLLKLGSVTVPVIVGEATLVDSELTLTVGATLSMTNSEMNVLPGLVRGSYSVTAAADRMNRCSSRSDLAKMSGAPTKTRFLTH